MKSGGKFIPSPAAISLEEQNWTSTEENRLRRETHFRLAFYWGRECVRDLHPGPEPAPNLSNVSTFIGGYTFQFIRGLPPIRHVYVSYYLYLQPKRKVGGRKCPEEWP